MGRISVRNKVLALGVSSIAAFSACPVAAQEKTGSVVSPPTEDQPSDSTEIIVTGLRRASTAQNTAAAIDVLGADRLEASGTNQTMALQFQTPGVLISQDLGLQTQVYIRGIGSNLQGIAVSNSVATYLDGVYLPNNVQSSQSFNDISRIEVLKGPQATLYGRNATGGAINIVTEKPSFETGGKADLSYGNYNDLQLRFGMTGPVIADQVAARFSVQYSKHDGYYHNAFLDRRVGDTTVVGMRGALLFTPASNLSITFRGDYTYNETADFLKLTPSTSVYYVNGTQYAAQNKPRTAYLDIQPREVLSDAGMAVTLEWDTGVGKVTSITSGRSFSAGPIYSDSDQVPVPGPFFPAGAGAIGSEIKSHSLYHETYIATDPSRALSAIIGGTYFLDRATELKRIQGPSIAVPRTFTDRFSRSEALAGYVDGTLRLSDQINVVAGIRYTTETRDYDFYRRVPLGATTHSSAKYTNWSPRVGVEIRPIEGTLLYATATSGFKSGGFNTDVPSNGFSPEKIWSYEVGAKTTLFDMLRLTASAFYYDYKNIQVLQYLTINSLITPIITNAGSAKLKGADLTADLRLTRDFTMGAGLSLLDSKFGSAQFCDPLFGSCTATNPANRPFVNVEGNRLPRAPATTANIYADYKVPMGNGRTFGVHGDAAYRSKTYYTVFQNDLYASPAFWLFNASARYTAPSGWFVEGYGQNLTDKLAITQIINSSPLRNPSTGVILAGTPARFERYAPPRTYGVRVGVKF